mmetsp:Transcript_25042/g.62064  ORF Transcript_25042/g.62064 Transcript_25042/m.62064 type:complete len:305 (+) Transcript_25042:692-1606(+)
MMIVMPPSETTCFLAVALSLASEARHTQPSSCTCASSAWSRRLSHTRCTAPCSTSSLRISSLLHARLCTALHAASTRSDTSACLRSAVRTSGTPPAAWTSRFCISPHARLAMAEQPSCCTATESTCVIIALETSAAHSDLPSAARTVESPQLRLEMAEQPSSCTTASAGWASIASRMRSTPPALTMASVDSSYAMLASAAQPRRWIIRWARKRFIAAHTSCAPSTYATLRREASPSWQMLASARQPSSSSGALCGCAFIAAQTRVNAARCCCLIEACWFAMVVSASASTAGTPETPRLSSTAMP